VPRSKHHAAPDGDMQTTRYLDSSGKSVELIQVTGDRYLLCADAPCYIPADKVHLLYRPAEDRRSRNWSRRSDRIGGRRRRDRLSLAEDQFRARTHEMLEFAESHLAMLRSRIGPDWGLSIG
jgi:hypothetical protein